MLVGGGGRAQSTSGRAVCHVGSRGCGGRRRTLLARRAALLLHRHRAGQPAFAPLSSDGRPRRRGDTPWFSIQGAQLAHVCAGNFDPRPGPSAHWLVGPHLLSRGIATPVWSGRKGTAVCITVGPGPNPRHARPASAPSSVAVRRPHAAPLPPEPVRTLFSKEGGRRRTAAPWPADGHHHGARAGLVVGRRAVAAPLKCQDT